MLIPSFHYYSSGPFFFFFFYIYDVNRSKSRYKLGLLPWCQQIAQCLLVNWGCWDRKGSTSSSNGSIENLKSICLCLQNLVFYLSLLSIDEQAITFFWKCKCKCKFIFYFKSLKSIQVLLFMSLDGILLYICLCLHSVTSMKVELVTLTKNPSQTLTWASYQDKAKT